jgi:hypothetical protein
MGKLLSNYRNLVVDDIINSGNHYYGIAANPVPSMGGVANVTSDDYSSSFNIGWQLLFGKMIGANDLIQVINNNIWAAGTVYTKYDNTLDMIDLSFYVITEPSVYGGTYNVYKCIDNNNGGPSNNKPDLIQATSFTKADGYTWRYLTSIANADWRKFATTSYAPIYSNTTIAAQASLNSGVEVVVVANGGLGYSSYHNGIVQGFSESNSSIIQISDTGSGTSGFYQNNSIYIYNSGITGEVKTISSYIANATGKFVLLQQEANTNNIVPGETLYKISPKVLFETDGVLDPQGYSVINTVSNSIYSVVIIEPGQEISWANVSIQSNTIYGSGANVYAIVPPPGGHGSEPAAELFTKGYSIAVSFIGDEANTIPDNVMYNKIGLIANPYEIVQTNGSKDTSLYSSNSFSSVLKANVASPITFTVGEQLVGANSGARGTVAFSNTSVVYLTGDKTFANIEYVTSTVSNQTTEIEINTRGDVYTKDLKPTYMQNVVDVERAVGQTEAWKLIIKI